MKLFYCFVFLALWAGYSDGTNSTWGFVNLNDALLHHSIRRQSSTLFKIVVENVRFPFPNQANNRTITAIRVIDQLPKSKAFAQIYAGGVGYKNVTIHFKSERSKGFNFSLEIYGR